MKLVVMVKMAKMVISHGYAHSVEFCDYGDYDSSAKINISFFQTLILKALVLLSGFA